MGSQDQLPTIEQVGNLPRWAAVAFAARCARRIYVRSSESLTDEDETYAEQAISWVERIAAERAEEFERIGRTPSVHVRAAELAVEAAHHAWEAERASEREYAEYRKASSEYQYGMALATDDNIARSLAESFARAQREGSARDDRLAVEKAFEIVRLVLADQSQQEALSRDFEILQKASRRWADSSKVPPAVYPLHSKFDLEEPIGDKLGIDVPEIEDREQERATIIELAAVFNSRLVNYFIEDPKRLYSLTPDNFEDLIAELFDGFGFAVERTTRTRDHGRDIIAIGHDIASVKYLIECKKYKESSKVGIVPVRGLYGVVQHERATKGILATTAPSFTKPAEEFLQKVEWQLEGRSFGGLVAWLKRYQEFKLRS